MPTVEVSFTPLPAHVRTARLIALAVARRAGVDETVLDEVRLAVGEACSRAVGVHQSRGLAQPVVMRLTDEQDRYTVEVIDGGPLEDGGTADDLAGFTAERLAAPLGDGAGDSAGLPEMPPGFGLAVISGLVEDVAVNADGDGTHVRMTWAAADVMAPGVG